MICNDSYIIKVMFVMNSSKSKGTQNILNCYSFRPKVRYSRHFRYILIKKLEKNQEDLLSHSSKDLV